MSSKRATNQETIEALLERSGREALPLAKLFVQHRDPQGNALPGPLSWFVRNHHHRALLQYLLLHAIAAGGDYSVAQNAKIWVRALRLKQGKNARAAVSRNWRWLAERKLIQRGRSGRQSKLTLLYDDGSGDPYQHPAERKDRYLQLPYAFWREEWDRQLDLPSLAVLLIALNEPPEFKLVQERVPDWYGISISTFQKGVQGLVRADLLQRHWEEEPRPLAPDGYVRVNVYRLLGAFQRQEGET